MKFTIQQKDLINPLVNLLRNTDKHEVYKNIQLDVISNDRIRLTSSNGVNTLEYKLPALNVEGNSIMICAKEFTDIVGRLNGKIDFEDGLIKNDKKKIKIGIINEAYFTHKEIETEDTKQLDANNLKSVIKNRIFACQSEGNGVLNSLCLFNNEVCATNGNLLSTGILSTDVVFDKLLISQNLAKEIVQCFEGEFINIGTKGSEIYVYDDILTIITKKVVGNFPNYKQLIPQYEKYIKLDKQKVLENLDLMMVVSDNNSPIVKITLDGSTMTLQSGYGDNEAISELDVDWTFEPITIAFNIQYLINVLRNTDSDIIELQLQAPLSAALIKDENNTNLIMPVQIR